MKKGIVIIFALISSFVISEILVSLILNFPKFGVVEKVRGITTLTNRGEVYKPHSKYINNEDGYKVFRRNNAGLPGSDIIMSDSSKFILVLGNSFVEGYQVDPDSISTSIFQKLLLNNSRFYQVVNLGASGHDIYDLWFRANYFDRIFPPSGVILVITEYNLLVHPQNLNFALPAFFGQPNNSVSSKIIILFRNSSSFINLVATAIKYSARKNNTNEDIAPSIDQNFMKSDDTLSNPQSGFRECLLEFKKKYGNKFIVLSIVQDFKKNTEFSNYCRLNQIHFLSSPLLNSEYEIKGGGHLNVAGNKKLGELMYESFINSISK